MSKQNDEWNSGDRYEYFMGRWSNLLAPEFLKWLDARPSVIWLDVGCGTGALSEAIYRHNKPRQVSCIDPSKGFIKKAKERLPQESEFYTGSATEIPSANDTFDVVVSGLALNFFPNLEDALTEIKRVSKKNGIIAAYVWDYAGRMDFLRYFWDAAKEIDSNSADLDEGVRFPICNSDELINLFQKSELTGIETTILDINIIFESFEDFWNPFLGGQGPAPVYLASLTKELSEKLKNNICERLPYESDGSIKSLARAIAIKGKCQL